ncbi:unnamed protein product [Diatraea saccharalis]|uniref:Uncharacterized protein n=1 Tax=Diatraea saccharalis TaxID=40085 RepID=A0A9N9R9A7_9NEOP|nr:unnamed protein product [Diatraea saccharalis]
MAFVPVLVLSALVLSCSGQAIDDYDSLDLECARENMYHCNDGAFEHYLCKDQNKCIPFEWMCNNVTECDDGSDEEDCTIMPEPDKNATCKGFACDGGRCISNLWICDGRYDCDDRSDEHSEDLCRKTLFPFPIHDVSTCTEIPNSGDRNYRCIDSSFCLPKSMMCNGIADCRDGSDEGPFCDKCNDTRCEPDRFGPACICASAPAFKTYNYATNACEDIDECARARPQCSHTCENVDGNFM